MKKYQTFLSILFLLTYSGISAQGINQDISSTEQSSILEDESYSLLFANYILKKWPNPVLLSKKGWEYNNSIILHGLEEVYLKTKDKRYLDYIQTWADNYISDSGDVLFDKSADNLDHLHPGILLLFLYEQTGNKKYKLAANTIRKEFDNQPRNSVGGFWHKKKYPNEMWVDGIYMAEPFLVKYGVLFNEQQYCFNEATKQLLLISKHAQDPGTGLLYHGWDEDKNATWADSNSGLSQFFWSRGMGWFTMALVDILDYLPKDYPDRAKVIKILEDVAKGLKDTQDSETGLWFQVMDKPNSPGNFLETSGSAMFIYALKKALDNNYIDSDYNKVVELGWKGIKSRVIFTSNGDPVITEAVKGMGVQGSYNSYINKSRLQNSTHGLCAIMLSASAMEY